MYLAFRLYRNSQEILIRFYNNLINMFKSAPLEKGLASMTVGGSETFAVHVQLMDGRKTKLNVTGDWTVMKLKTEFGKYHGLRAENIKFVYKAKHMSDEKQLKVYKVTPDSVIISTERSTGGDISTENE